MKFLLNLTNIEILIIIEIYMSDRNVTIKEHVNFNF